MTRSPEDESQPVLREGAVTVYVPTAFLGLNEDFRQPIPATEKSSVSLTQRLGGKESTP